MSNRLLLFILVSMSRDKLTFNIPQQFHATSLLHSGWPVDVCWSGRKVCWMRDAPLGRRFVGYVGKLGGLPDKSWFAGRFVA